MKRRPTGARGRKESDRHNPALGVGARKFPLSSTKEFTRSTRQPLSASRFARLESELNEMRALLSALVSKSSERVAEPAIPDTDATANMPSTAKERVDLRDVDLAYRTGALSRVACRGAAEGHFRRHLVIPIHLPKLSHLSSLFPNREDTAPRDDGILLSIVATTEAERATIERYVKLLVPPPPITIEVIAAEEICSLLGWNDLASAIRENRSGGIINMKKLIALYRAISIGAERIHIIDSDAVFLTSPQEALDAASRNYAHGKYFAAYSSIDITRDVSRNCMDYFGSSASSELNHWYSAGIFSWFVDIPTYHVEDVRDFFAHIGRLHGGVEFALSSLTWHHFEHILFINFLLLVGRARLIDVRSIVEHDRISDALTAAELEAIHEVHGYKPAWATLSALLSSGHDLASCGFHVACHIDRI